MNDIAIKVESISKIYKLYDKPIDRMKEALSLTKKKYGNDHYALNDVSFEIKRGETVGIIGTNGSGKSTLLKIITGVLTQSSGKVEVNGKISALLELGAGFNPEYTGMENIYLNGTMMGYTKEEMDERVKPIVDFADIGEFINQPVKTYSSGMFARLAFAVAINVEPDILIVDEVLSVGDMRFQIKCMDRMKSMIDNNGTTVLFVSHDINSIRRFCKKGIWINNGQMMSTGEINTTCDKYVDYLNLKDKKTREQQKENIEVKNIQEDSLLPKYENVGGIAKIIDFKTYNSNGEEVNSISTTQPLTIRVVYDVYEQVESPVLGIALKRIDDDYVCGLNTLLDNVTIPWNIGRNIFYLNYTHGTRALGGEYYFDVALFDKTATVNIQYISKIKKIKIYTKYLAEGRYIIPHVWRARVE